MAWPPRAHYDHGGLIGPYGPHVCISTQPWKLPPQNVSTKEQFIRTERFRKNQALL